MDFRVRLRRAGFFAVDGIRGSVVPTVLINGTVVLKMDT